MPKLSPVVSLDRILDKLTKQWHEHRDALAKIEVVFRKYGINATQAVPATSHAQPAAEKAIAPAGKKRRKRGTFAQTADEFILGLLSGGKSLSTAEINAEWRQAGRKNKADINLSKLTKEKKLKRTPVKDGRGSKYTVA
jgi:hypothetical protein